MEAMAIGMAALLPAAPPVHLQWRLASAMEAPYRPCLRFQASASPHCCWEGYRRAPVAFALASSSASGTGAGDGEGKEAKVQPPKRRLRKIFQYMATRPEQRPNYLLWAAGLVFCLLMSRTIFEELQKWPGFFMEIWEFLKFLGSLVLQYLAENAREPLVWSVTLVGWAGMFIADLYAYIVEMTPVWVLLKTIVLSSAVLSLGEAVRINAAADQPWILGFAALAGFGGILGLWGSKVFLGMLTLLSVISYLRNRDVVIALLPPAAVLVAVGEPLWQIGSFIFYLALAVYKNWTTPETKEKVEERKWNSPPMLVMFAVAIGINLAVKWLHARRIVWLAT